jgi:hypothetical protein
MTKCDGRTNVPEMCFVGLDGPEIPNIRQVRLVTITCTGAHVFLFVDHLWLLIICGIDTE